MYENSVHLIGFLGADAQSRTTRDGVPLTILSLATKRSWKDTNGEWQSQTEWHRVTCFGHQPLESRLNELNSRTR